MNKYHPNLTLTKWRSIPKSTQILNIASEFSRAKNWLKKKDDQEVKNCLNRALELMDLSVEDKKWRASLKELLRFRELLAEFYIQKDKDEDYFKKLFRVWLNFSEETAKVKI